jgi:hypothetical protein
VEKQYKVENADLRVDITTMTEFSGSLTIKFNRGGVVEAVTAKVDIVERKNK